MPRWWVTLWMRGKGWLQKMKLESHRRYLMRLNLINWIFKRLKDRPLDDVKSSQACNITLRSDRVGAKSSTLSAYAKTPVKWCPQKHPTPFSYKSKSNLWSYMVKRMGDKTPPCQTPLWLNLITSYPWPCVLCSWKGSHSLGCIVWQRYGPVQLPAPFSLSSCMTAGGGAKRRY